METDPFRNILVATDYSKLSENAVATAAGLCRRFSGVLTIVHVIEFTVPPETPHLVLDYGTVEDNFARSQLTDLGDSVREEYGIQVNEVLEHGDDAAKILHAAREAGAGLVVVGTHGVSGFRSLFIGSTAYRVIKHAKVPVMTVPGGGNWRAFRDILFPIRLIPDALERYDCIRALIREYGSTLHIIGLIREPVQEPVEEVTALAEKLTERLKEEGVPHEVTYERCHNFADRVLTTAVEKKADLIVITATLDFTLREFFVGPFCQHIINHAKVPVLCLRGNHK